MKTIIIKRLAIAIIISAILSFFISYFIQIGLSKNSFYADSESKIDQIMERVVYNNSLNLEMTEKLKDEYLAKANIMSHILEYDPELMYDIDALHEYMDLLLFEEIHFFDETGTIFAGTNPEYYGISFDDGEQIGYFTPMLEDRDLEMAQDLVPNTATQKLIQYVIVWNEDKDVMIQLGHEPQHLIDQLKHTQLSSVMSSFITDENTYFFAYDALTQEILTDFHDSTLMTEIKNLQPSQTAVGSLVLDKETFHYYAKAVDNLVISFSISQGDLYNNALYNILLLTLMLTLTSAIIILIIAFLLTNIIIKPIYTLIDNVQQISKGNLDIVIDINNTPEFSSLSTNINSMVIGLVNFNMRITRLFHNITIPIALFEYSKDDSPVKATNKLGDILQLQKQETSDILSTGIKFNQYLEEIFNSPLDGEDDIYLIRHEDHIHYLKLKLYDEDGKVWGIIVDMTKELNQHEEFRSQRNIDNLTSLDTRWAFREKMDKLFKEDFGIMAILILDLDNLKPINDNYGHDYGDALLTTAADILKNCTAPHKIVSRMGGDEFVMTIHHATSRQEVINHITELQKQIDLSYITSPNGERIPISFSGGYVFHDDTFTNYDDMIIAADATMYTVKRLQKGHLKEHDKNHIDDNM